ncbi:MAG: NADH-quinone oxidoreductase subunit NuoI [Deltaproteobacteria bacterium]|nr:NADH-quinone oxidoreductase subunit NuoI [Deltaproteobacteria bacterium]
MSKGIGQFIRGIGRIFANVFALLKGLRLTLAMFFSRPITIQYPEKKREVSPRWRGVHYFERNEKGDTRCVACGLCVAICPSQCIRLVAVELDSGERYPELYEINTVRCIYCGMCAEACPVNAIKLGRDYEFVAYGREDLVLDKDRLLANAPGEV